MWRFLLKTNTGRCVAYGLEHPVRTAKCSISAKEIWGVMWANSRPNGLAQSLPRYYMKLKEAGNRWCYDGNCQRCARHRLGLLMALPPLALVRILLLHHRSDTAPLRSMCSQDYALRPMYSRVRKRSTTQIAWTRMDEWLRLVGAELGV